VSDILAVQISQYLWHIWQQDCEGGKVEQNLLECKGFLQFQTGENRRKNTPSLLSGSLQNSRNRIMFLWPFALWLLSRNGISSQWTRHYSFWQPNVPQPNFFSFSKSFHSNVGTCGFFLPFFSDLLGF
jgi:hypothetical protein